MSTAGRIFVPVEVNKLNARTSISGLNREIGLSKCNLQKSDIFDETVTATIAEGIILIYRLTKISDLMQVVKNSRWTLLKNSCRSVSLFPNKSCPGHAFNFV